MRTPRAKAGPLLTWLYDSQWYDTGVTTPVMNMIRYVLHYSNRCALVTFKSRESSRLVEPILSMDDLSNHLRSQLDAQNITDDSSLWTQVKPLVQFIQKNLSRPDHTENFPTLFAWYSKERHRTFFFFAFIRFAMASRTYTARGLLRMRHVPLDARVEEILRARLRSDSDLVGVVRIPSDPALPPTNGEVKEDEPKKEESKKDGLKKEEIKKDSSDSGHHDRASAPQLDGTDSEWKYVRRSDSEQTETQPITAPSGLAAQKSEGFQKFYKAVISPTHVRVTAGGRIVPNTRGSQSPTTKWARERTLGDPSAGSHLPTTVQSGVIPYPMMQPQYGLPYGPMMNGFPSSMHQGAGHAPAPYPVMTVPMAFNIPGGYAMPPPTFNHFQPPNVMIDQPNGSSQSDRQREASASDQARPVRISPPEQFDQSRPFYYNGQWMMPNGQQFYSGNMMQPHGFQSALMPGQMMVSAEQNGANPSSQAALNHVADYSVGKSEQSIQSQPVVTSAVSAVAPMQHPPISSIRPSEITKKQIQSLRGSVKYYEDQLLYNKHQIDEKSVEQQAQMIRHQIGQFEKNLEGQLSFEADHYPKIEAQNDSFQSTFSKDASTMKTTKTSDLQPNMPQPTQRECIQASIMESIINRETGPAQTVRGLNSSKSIAALQPTMPAADLAADDKLISKKASSLPIHAALAPPFEPRPFEPRPFDFWTIDKRPRPPGVPSPHDKPIEDIPLVNDHLVPKGGSGWRSFFKDYRSVIDLGQPYLVGELPEGIAAEDATQDDYVYERPLTDDELRARYMFCGKTPRHLQKGLPKFDGKNFYPPSPVQGSSTLATLPATSPVTSSVTSPVYGENYQADDEESQPEQRDPYQGMAASGLATNRARLGPIAMSDPPLDWTMRYRPLSELPRSASLLSELRRASPCLSQTSEVYRAFRQFDEPNHYDTLSPSMKSCEDSLKSKSSPDDASSDSEKSLIFQGRRAMERNGNKGRNGSNTILSNMLKKGKTSAVVAPGKVSPTTAHGLIPNYAGHATASLAPTIANTAGTSRAQYVKGGEVNNVGADPAKRAENLPPVDRRLEETRRGASRQGKGIRNLGSR
ncbi:hypothetical protein AK830_g7252 [Neonectria ditissima]|uniref:Uncharacterized protein n=1 Tax=Neonectria ditissima TaxID=78410 RepID=A0A0P7BGP1_9HYPO|nr:hypothetical protein AK830_g7252 [Neonectria ditissima]